MFAELVGGLIILWVAYKFQPKDNKTYQSDDEDLIKTQLTDDIRKKITGSDDWDKYKKY